MNLRAAGVIDVLQIAVDRPGARLRLHDEAESGTAPADINGATAGYLAHGRARRQGDVGALRHEGIASTLGTSLESSRSCREVGGVREAGDVGVRVGQGVQRNAGADLEPTPAEVA